jgi:glycosyltransferase involved in cell wall biosynthesis
MIVRDEAENLAGLVESVAPYISYWVVVDTGSRDDTVERLRRLFAERAIPGEVHQRPWRDFGANRSEALRLAQGKADYIWVIDADDRVHGTLDLGGLHHDAYDLRFGEDFSFWRRQIFKDGLGWEYRGVLHEYPHCAGATRCARLEGAYWIETGHRGARSRRPDPHRRDAEILARALEGEPANERYWFYLGQTWLDAGEPARARDAYRRRIELGGWPEETFYAQLRLGHCAKALGDPAERVLEEFLRAHELRPARSEPIYEMAVYCRERGWFELAFLLAERAAELPLPVEETLFVHADVYRYRALDELVISAYHAGRPDAGCRAAAELRRRAVPESERERIAGHLALYPPPPDAASAPAESP